jgi:hypothetical protein
MGRWIAELLHGVVVVASSKDFEYDGWGGTLGQVTAATSSSGHHRVWWGLMCEQRRLVVGPGISPDSLSMMAWLEASMELICVCLGGDPVGCKLESHCCKKTELRLRSWQAMVAHKRH